MPRGRPAYLPAQEDITGTYMDPDYLPAGRVHVNRITGNSLEDEVREAWGTILAGVFSVYEGYSLAYEARIEAQRLDMKVSRLVNNGDKNFLVLELKRSSYSSSSRSLAAAEEQLMGYLEALPHTDQTKLWGALCIGKNVQFYKVTLRPTVQLTILHDDMFRIDRQPETVTQWLQYIKSQATWS